MLSSKRLRLREIEDSDTSILKSILLDKNIMKFIPNNIKNENQVNDRLQSLTNAKKIENRKQYFLIIEEKKSREAIGFITIKIISDSIENGIGILGYTLLNDYWGKGYVTEASNCIISFAFKKMKLHRVEASSVPENNSSEKVLKKIGMKYEGKKRKSLKIEGMWYDELQYGILKEDYLSFLGY